MLNSNRHDIYIASLEDKYGSYGKIGLCLIEHEDDIWKIKLLITSCRVISKGIGSVMVNCLLHRAQKAGVQLFAEFIPTEYNRMMYILYKFFDFYEVENIGDMVLLKNNMEHIPQYPGYLSIFWND